MRVLLLRLPPRVPRVSTPRSLLALAMLRNLSVRSPGITRLLRPLVLLRLGLADLSKVGAELEAILGLEFLSNSGAGLKRLGAD